MDIRKKLKKDVTSPNEKKLLNSIINSLNYEVPEHQKWANKLSSIELAFQFQETFIQEGKQQLWRPHEWSFIEYKLK